MSAKVVLLSLMLALAARGQSLRIQGAPLSVRLGGRTAALTIERLDAAGLPVTTDNTMVVVTAPPGGQVSLGAEPFSAWGPMVTLSLLPGSSVSPPFYLRSGRRGLSSWTAGATGYTSAVATVLVRDDALTCDLESGTRLDTELPPGCFNVSIAPYPQSSMTSSMSAAHRGSFGVRLVDGESSMGDAADTALFDDTAPMFGDFHARSWVRVVTTNGQGVPIIAQFTNATGMTPSLIDLKLRPNLDLAMGGFGADAGYSSVVADAGLSMGAWHLLEFAVTGTGTNDGGRAVWLDGRLLLEQRAVDFSGTRMSVARLAVGEPYADDRRWLGTIDFDDLRSAGVPLASRLEVQAPDGGFWGECLPLEVQLRASAGGALTPAGEQVPISLDAGGLATLFVDPSCGVRGEQVVMGAGASVTTVSFRTSQPGVVFHAHTPDFLSTSQAVALTAPPSLGIVPAQTRARAGEVLTFSVTGGTGRGVGFRMAANPSGGIVDAMGGYRAGNTTGVLDRIEASDSAGQTAVAAIEVIPPEMGDAGADAGAADAGAVDGGAVDAGEVDAGEVDAGEVDAGEVDAGEVEVDAGTVDAGSSRPPLALGVGCGCSSTGPPLLGLLLLALRALRRRR